MARKSNRNNSNRRQKSSGSRRAARPPTNRQYPRTARLNTLIHEIVAEYFERTDDDRFEMVTITGVEVDADLNKAQVFVSTLGLLLDDEASSGDAAGGDGSEDEELLDALAEHRKPVQAMIGRQARMRKTPEVVFALDPSVRSGARIEEILSSLESRSLESPTVDETNEAATQRSEDPDAEFDVDAPEFDGQ